MWTNLILHRQKFFNKPKMIHNKKNKIMKTTNNMKKLILSAAFLVASLATVAQVGIGTTTPSGVLDVIVDKDAGDSDIEFVVRRVNDPGSSSSYGVLKLVRDDDNPAVGRGVNVAFSGNNSNSESFDYGYIQAAPVSVTDGLEEARITLFTRSSSGSYNNFTFGANGGLGIGNEDPTSKLHVVGTGGETLSHLSQSDNTHYVMRLQNGAGDSRGLEILGGLNNDAVPLRIASFDGTTEVVRVNGNGNISTVGTIKVGDTAITATAGMIRFKDGVFEGFDGTSWIAFH
jgi:hypothetical protein